MVVALIDYEPGDPIQICEPLFKFVAAEKIGRVCTNFFKENLDLKTCAGCGVAFYCNKKCQAEDWNFAHKSECKSYCYRNWCTLGSHVQIHTKLKTIRMVAAFHQNPSLINKRHKVFDGSELSFKDLDSHRDQGKKIPPMGLLDMVNLRKYMYYHGGVQEQIDRLLELFNIGRLHSIAICNFAESEELGGGLYVEHTVFNHSCKPNADFTNLGSKGTVRAISKIRKGEEIYIRYIPGRLEKRERQELLREDFYIDCHCEQCEAESNSSVDYVELNKLIEEMESKTLVKGLSFEEALRKHHSIMEIYRKIYYEYDRQISLQFLWLERAIAMSPELLSLPEDKYNQLMENEIGHHLKTTFGPEHFHYKQHCRVVNMQAVKLQSQKLKVQRHQCSCRARTS